MKAPRCFPALALALGVAAQAPAQPVFSGEASWSALASWSEAAAADPASLSADAGLELGLDARSGPLRASFLARADLLTGAAAPAAAQFAAAGMSDAWVAAGPGAEPEYALAASLERAWLRWNPGPFSLTGGRQVVNWGRALLWSPADLFAETALAGISPERAGVDAIRLAVPIGALGSLEAVAVPAAAFSDGRYGGRLSGTVPFADLGLAARWDGAAGTLAIAGELKADAIVGLWAELRWTAPERDPAAGTAALTAGADYSFLGGDLVLSAEYHYDQAGAAPGAPAAPGARWPGRHYLFASTALKAGDFASVSASAVGDLEAALWSIMAALALDLAQGSTLSLGLGASNGSLATRVAGWSATANASASLSF